MIFAISALMNQEESRAWFTEHFHPDGIRCLHCDATPEQTRSFRTSKRGVVDWQCRGYRQLVLSHQ